MNIVSFGGGVNSTAMILGLNRMKIPVDAILFADTGGEKPETYEFLLAMNRIIGSGEFFKGLPQITTVRDENRTLEQECLEGHTLPSIVTGMRSCSDKYKIRPQNRWIAAWGPAQECWARGEKITKFVGFDAGEAHRVKDFDSKRFLVRYPLVEWEWGREECIEEIKAHGIWPPPKSSCFFCPEMKEWEIVELYQKHPDLIERAFRMEEGNTKIYGAKGLARKYSWAQIIDYHKNQRTLPIVGGNMPCVCFDGDSE